MKRRGKKIAGNADRVRSQRLWSGLEWQIEQQVKERDGTATT
jgi:hypothetical protein